MQTLKQQLMQSTIFLYYPSCKIKKDRITADLL